jgi:hypothetical protein
LEKYFFPPLLVRFFLCDADLDPLGRDTAGSDGSETSIAGGVRKSAGEIGGGGGTSGSMKDVVDVRGESGGAEVGEQAEVGEPGGGPSESSSFSHTMSGVQIRSGRDRTSSAGARSASRWLEASITCQGKQSRKQDSPSDPHAVHTDGDQ